MRGHIAAFFAWIRGYIKSPHFPHWLIAIGTFLLASFAYYAWDEATKGTDIARKQLIAGQSAFVFIDGADFIPENSNGAFLAWQFVPKWQNRGNTRTVNLTTYVNYTVMDNPFNYDFVNFDLATNGAATVVPFDLGPHQTTVLAYFQIPVVSFKLIRTPTKGLQDRLFIWGHARYNDVFPGTFTHTTRFCWEVLGWRGDPEKEDVYSDGTPIFHPAINLCPRGNCSDEECK